MAKHFQYVHASKYPRPAVIEFSLNSREGATLCSREDHSLQTVYKCRGNFKILWVEWKTCLPMLFIVRSLSHVQIFATPWTRAPQASLPFTIRVCSNSCPLSQWCYLTVSSSAALLFCLQSFPASGSLPMSQLFTSGGQSIGDSASVLPMTIQGWFPLWLTGLILQPKRLSRVFSSTIIRKHQFFSLPYGPTLTSTHDYW